MANTAQDSSKTSPQPAPCPPSTPLQKKILELEGESKLQDVNDAKAQLAELNKINGDVEQAKAKYKQEYDSMTFAAAQFTEYVKQRETRITAKVTPSEKTLIDKEIVDCAQSHVTYLETEWKKVRGELSDLQKRWAQADIARLEAEGPYKRILDYKAKHKDLEALQAQSTKEFDAENFHGAYFLVVREMKAKLQVPSSPKKFGEELESAAMEYFIALEEARKAKAALDQKTDDAQKKKKSYDDAKTKLRETILKVIAETPFDGPSPEGQPESTSSPEQTEESAGKSGTSGPSRAETQR